MKTSVLLITVFVGFLSIISKSYSETQNCDALITSSLTLAVHNSSYHGYQIGHSPDISLVAGVGQRKFLVRFAGRLASELFKKANFSFEGLDYGDGPERLLYEVVREYYVSHGIPTAIVNSSQYELILTNKDINKIIKALNSDSQVVALNSEITNPGSSGQSEVHRIFVLQGKQIRSFKINTFQIQTAFVSLGINLDKVIHPDAIVGLFVEMFRAGLKAEANRAPKDFNITNDGLTDAQVTKIIASQTKLARASFYETTIGRAAGRLPLQSIIFYYGRNQVLELDVPALAVYEANELNRFFDRALNAQKFVDSIVRIEQ